jgi:hypothetical protein
MELKKRAGAARPTYIALVCLAVVTFAVVCFAGKQFVKPTAQTAKTYPAHDEHPTEKVTVGVDPYDMADKAKVFTVNYSEEGYLPVLLIVSNDSDQPISLNDMKAQLVTVNHTKLSPATPDDLYRRLSHPAQTGTSYPLPFPRKKVKGAVSKEALDEINSSQFSAKAVEPHGTQSGFVFFDISGISTPLAGASFYLTGLRDSSGSELMYFEIPMAKYLSVPVAKPVAQ